MMVKKEEKIIKKKKHILDALKAKLENNVYSQITIQDIADQAGYSKGGILHYFSTKEDIYLALIEDIFTELEESHAGVLDWALEGGAVASMSALVGVENFILDKVNIKIMINLILYAFQEPKVMVIIQEYIRKQFLFYKDIIRKSTEKSKGKRVSDLDDKHIARIAQTIVLFIGVLESIDPVEIDHIEIVKYISAMIKG